MILHLHVVFVAVSLDRERFCRGIGSQYFSGIAVPIADDVKAVFAHGKQIQLRLFSVNILTLNAIRMLPYDNFQR